MIYLTFNANYAPSTMCKFSVASKCSDVISLPTEPPGASREEGRREGREGGEKER